MFQLSETRVYVIKNIPITNVLFFTVYEVREVIATPAIASHFSQSLRQSRYIPKNFGGTHGEVVLDEVEHILGVHISLEDDLEKLSEFGGTELVESGGALAVGLGLLIEQFLGSLIVLVLHEIYYILLDLHQISKDKSVS